jgi:TonB family protein
VPGEAADMLPPLLDALSYVHGKQFVHSRIKPSNVLAVGNQLKLSADQVVAAAEMTSARKRRDAYDAPETAAGIVSPAGDVWSVGVTLVAALTQNAAFAEGTSSNDPNLPATVPEPFRGIARECLHLDPKRRCSIAEIQKRLQPAGRSVPATAFPAPHPRTPIKRGPIAALLIIAALIALGVFFSRGKSGTAPATTQQATPPTSPQAAPEPKPDAAVRARGVTRKKAVAAQGEVVHEVIPDVSKNSRNTITGTVKVTVQVEVEPSGKVASAKLKNAGPSKYFAGLALKAGQRWEFSPQPTANTWLIQFRFKRNGTQASAERVNR